MLLQHTLPGISCHKLSAISFQVVEKLFIAESNMQLPAQCLSIQNKLSDYKVKMYTAV
jgi:hypothetical protein